MIKVETWNGHQIRFVWHEDDWWAVLKDITDALGLSARWVNQRLSKDVVSNHPLETNGGKQEMLIVNEMGIYESIFSSRKPEAKEFRTWTYTMLKEIRQSIGLEGFQVFKMLDKQVQKEAMEKLRTGLKAAEEVDFIKANTISNKAVSNMYGFKKLVKKNDMSPDMLVSRQAVLTDTVELMTVKDKFGLEDVSVSKAIYSKYHN